MPRTVFKLSASQTWEHGRNHHEIAGPAVIGLLLGAIAGGAIGVGAGFLWITVFHTSDFEGYSGMLVFFTFMPIGIIVGALFGAIILGAIAARDRTSSSPGAN